MNVRKTLVVACSILLLGATPFSSVAHKDASVASIDEAINHAADVVLPAVYTIEISMRMRKSGATHFMPEIVGRGTAFGITETGLVMTALHNLRPYFTGFPKPIFTPPGTYTYEDGDVVEGTYALVDQNGVYYLPEVVALHPDKDIAILSIAKSSPGKKFPYVEFERGKLGYSNVIAVGTPHSFRGTITLGIISHPSRPYAREETTGPFVQTSAMIHPGNSGGPLVLLANHRVAGVVSWNYSTTPSGIGLGFAVPASDAAKFLDDTLILINKREAERRLAQ